MATTLRNDAHSATAMLTARAGWDQYFDSDMRRQLLDDDLKAGKTISAVLVAIICFGLALGILAVCAALYV